LGEKLHPLIAAEADTGGEKNNNNSSGQSLKKSARNELQNKVGQGHRPARYNYTVKLSLLLLHNGG